MSTNYQSNFYKLDSETLFLLRSCALLYIEDYEAPRKFESESDLKAHLKSVSETKKYFTRLKEEMGTVEGSRCRKEIKISTIWNTVCNVINKRLSAGRMANCMASLEKVVKLFGFDSAEELRSAAIRNERNLKVSGSVSSETQDLVAQVFGFKDWYDMNNEDSTKYRISEGVLMRAYGKQKCASALTLKSLNVISQFICDRNWEEYANPKTRLQVREEILSKLVKAPKVSQNTYKASDFGPFKEGDYIRVQHRDGTVSVYHFSNDKFEECFGLVA